MAIYDCEIFSKVIECTLRSFHFRRRSCSYSSRARPSAVYSQRWDKLSRLLASNGHLNGLMAQGCLSRD
ncbi:hypothetical protein KCU69_g15, partial [Aureobasidium melanogenum]